MTDITQTALGQPVEYEPDFYDGLCEWRDEDGNTALRVVRMIEEVLLTPGEGIGRPKRLAGIPGGWSRRITRHHRLYYIVTPAGLTFVSCRGHDFPEPLRAELCQRAARA